MNKGLFIVLYGVNNLGKSTQAKLLVDELNANGHKAEYIKYAIYNLAPSGPLINNYLRGGNTYNLSAREVQLLHALNRTQYEPILEQKLASGITIVAEDYIGTSIAWGVASGVDEAFLCDINSHLRQEDFAFLLTGKRFTIAMEHGHPNETNEAWMVQAVNLHKRLGEKHQWKKIDANRAIETVHDEIWQAVKNLVL